MGKKRNNAAKKKQAAAKKKLSSAYGVSVLKGGTIARNNGVLDANLNAQAKKQNAESTKTDGGSKQASSAQHKSDNASARDIPGKRSRQSSNENDEFQRMHASLEERSLARQARNDDLRRGKKERQKRQKKGWGKFAGPSTNGTNFAPATLTLAPKTTKELVDDAAAQVARGMNEIGQRAMLSPDGIAAAAAAEGKSSLAAAASMAWHARVSNVHVQNVQNQTQQQPQEQNNPFAALDEDSDSDNEWADKKSKLVPQFQFQPASFSFQPTVPPVAAVAAPGDDIDPDL